MCEKQHRMPLSTLGDQFISFYKRIPTECKLYIYTSGKRFCFLFHAQEQNHMKTSSSSLCTYNI